MSLSDIESTEFRKRYSLKDMMRKNGPRWIVLLIDTLVVWLTFAVSYLLIFKKVGIIDFKSLFVQAFVVSLIYFISFRILKSYRSIIRRTGLRDLILVCKCLFVAFIFLFVVSELLELVVDLQRLQLIGLNFSQTQLLFHALLLCVGLLGLRLLYKSIYHNLYWGSRQSAIHVILFGAGNMGHNAYNLLQLGSRNRYKVVAIVDDNVTRIGRFIQGIRIRPLQELNAEMLKQIGGAQELVIAIDNSSPERLAKISEFAEKLPLKLKIMPSSVKLMEGAVATRQIRTLKVADLLGRNPIELNNPIICNALANKVILITGGAGSIGSELVRQIARTDCTSLLILDQAESALYDLQQELGGLKNFDRLEFIVGNVRDKIFMTNIFERIRPQFVFHAAAYKHVPLMEANPYEAILTNVCGSYNVASLSDTYHVEKFVMVSTDKAVNPTNVMGATKRVAEIAISAINKNSKTNFIVTRFGNVLGSNGSVIPLFEKQIDMGGPITITHPDITRYFMTIPEACQLVQEAGVMGNGGEIFVFDMGVSVKIMDLAKKMISLKGLSYPDDIDIKIVGLRPGEKIYEELLANDENTTKTHHEKIMIARVNHVDFDEKKKKIDELCYIVQSGDNLADQMKMVSLIKEIVPEFKSQNSVFETLDFIKPQFEA